MRKSTDRALEILDAVEVCWREVLSLLDADDVLGASRQMQAADELLPQLQSTAFPAGEDTSPALAEVAARTRRLSALHRELQTRCKCEMAKLQAALAETRRGSRALKAYSLHRFEGMQLDQLS